MNRRRKTIAGIKGTPAEKRNDQNKPKPQKSPKFVDKFRKNLAEAREFESKMGQVRSSVGLQPGATEYKGPKRLTPRERRQREMKQYQISRTKTAPRRKPESAE
tara:strand:+ start:94 stop:405 length:312 start_codon:yes stop_codon:yes gene_type:complete